MEEQRIRGFHKILLIRLDKGTSEEEGGQEMNVLSGTETDTASTFVTVVREAGFFLNAKTEQEF